MKWINGAIAVAIGLALHLAFTLVLAPLVGAFYVVEPGHSMMVQVMRVAAVARSLHSSCLPSRGWPGAATAAVWSQYPPRCS